MKRESNAECHRLEIAELNGGRAAGTGVSVVRWSYLSGIQYESNGRQSDRTLLFFLFHGQAREIVYSHLLVGPLWRNVPVHNKNVSVLGETNGVFLMKFLMKGANVRNMMSTHTTFDSSQNTT